MAIIGREPFVDIVLPFPQVSSRHACLEPLGAGRYRVVDLGSSNGTYVSGRKVDSSDLRDGEDLRFGSVSFDWNAHRGTLNAEAALPPGMILGRDPACDLVVSDGRVSNRHLRVIPQVNRLVILDLGSANGLSLNGRPVTRASVSPTDDVRLGSLRVDLFSLVARRPTPPVQTPIAPRSQPVFVAQPAVPALPPVPTVHARRRAPVWPWAAAALAVAIAGMVALFATREEIVKACELGPEEVFREKVFFFQADGARTRAQQIRWCPTHANEPVAVTRTYLCSHCGKPYNKDEVRKPRRENPQDFDVRGGFCAPCNEPVTVKRSVKCEVCGRIIRVESITAPRRTDPRDTEVSQGVCDSVACRLERMGTKAGAGAKDTIDKVLDGLKRPY